MPTPKHLAVLVVAMLIAACGSRRVAYYPDDLGAHVDRYAGAKAEHPPLAREIRWIHQAHLVNMGQVTNVFNYDAETMAEIEILRKNDGKLEALPEDALLRRLEDPAVSAGELVGLGAAALEARMTTVEGQAVLQDHVDWTQELSDTAIEISASDAQLSKVTQGLGITVTALNGLTNVLLAISPIVDASVRKLYGEEITAALQGAGFVGPEAPEGSVLFVYLYMESKETHNPVRHFATVHRADLRLLRTNAKSIDATDGIDTHVFRKRKAVSPGPDYTTDKSWAQQSALQEAKMPLDRVLVRAAAKHLEAAVLAEAIAAEAPADPSTTEAPIEPPAESSPPM